MPWKEQSVSNAKLQFIADCLRGDEPMTVVCRRHGISRETGYLWLRRYHADGPAGLEEHSRAPRHHGRASSEEVAARLVALRRERPHWGARKLLATLWRQAPELPWPAASTATDILRRAGLVTEHRRGRHAVPVEQPFRPVTQPNDTWCIDFKGWFRTGDGIRCDPLTLTDAHSRYFLCCRIMPEQSQPVRAAVDELFAEYGLPAAMRSDNGPPFASQGAAGLSRLSAHWARLGIRLERITPGQPQQNGQHERMHGTLKAETTQPPAASVAEQQARFDAYRDDYNHNRPHEALGQTMPAEHYQPSPRPLPAVVPEPWYDADHEVRRVRKEGCIKWAGDLIFISEALAGELVGIAAAESGNWTVRFADIDLGIIDRRTRKLVRFAAGRPPRGPASSEVHLAT